jgi:hypothetical protein
MRFAGAVGFATPTSTAPGVWKDVIVERQYLGDVIRESRRLGAPSLVPPEVAGTISVQNSFSIVADAEAYESFMHIRYVNWLGENWEVTDVEVRRPRLILTIGGLWNGDTP